MVAKASILPYLEQLRYHSRLGANQQVVAGLQPCQQQKTLMRKSVLVVVCAIVAVALAAGCSRKDETEPAVATPSLTVGKDRVAIGSPVKMTYKFQVASDARFDGDYTVFVHVLDPDGELLWTEDHQPPTPTSAWQPGQTVEYERLIFVPNYPYIGEATIRLGLYQPASGRRLTLAGEHVSRKEYQVARVQILPQSENIFLIYKDGWHSAEVLGENAAVEWQWTKKTATISFRNPKKDVTLYLDTDARVDAFNPPQQVTLRIGDQVVATFAADNKDRKLRTFPIGAAQLGPGDMTELVLDVDRTFVPGGGDSRELGIRVYHVFVEPK